MTNKITFFLLLLIISNHASAELIITAVNNPVTINFNGFTGGGFSSSPTASQLDSDDMYARGFSDNWVTGTPGYGGSSSNTGDYARGQGNDTATTSGIYNFTNTGNNAIGFQGTGTEFGGASGGFLRIRLQNQTGFQITGFNISYDLYSRSTSGGSRTQTVSFALSNDDFVSNSNNVASLSTLALSTATWTTNTLSASSIALTVDNSNYIYLQFYSADAGGSGARPKFAFDNITVTATSVVPEPAAVSMLLLGLIGARGVMRRRRQT